MPRRGPGVVADPIETLGALPGQKPGFLLDLALRVAGEEWSEAGENPTPYFERLLSRASDQVSMVCGNLRPPLIEQLDVLKLLATKLHAKVRLDIIFDKPGAMNARDAENALRRDNQGTLVLKRRYPQLVRLFWLPGEPALDFTVVDSRDSFIESPGKVHGEPPPTITRYDDMKLAATLQARFVATLPLAREIDPKFDGGRTK